MEIPQDVLIISAALIVLSAIAWFELRYIKGKGGEQAEASLEQDHAYNSMATIRAVASSLRSQGYDVTEAEILLLQAEGAYKRRQYLDCRELSDRAKIALRNAPLRKVLECPPPAKVEVNATSKERETGTAAPAEVPSMGARKLPRNYLESKFVMESAHCLMENAPERCREAVQCHLDDAKACFDGGEYTDALRHAVKAKRVLEGAEEIAPEEKREDAPAAEVVTEQESACPGCGAVMSEEDAFCFSCGRPGKATCPGCSADIAEGDAFCRKCGIKL